MFSSKKLKATFVLSSQILDELKEAVYSGAARSASALVREAIEERLKKLREEKIRMEFEEAVQDPAFMRDLEQTMADFQTADAETVRFIPQ